MPDDIKEQYNYYDRQEKRFNRLYRGSIANTNRKEYKDKMYAYEKKKDDVLVIKTNYNNYRTKKLDSIVMEKYSRIKQGKMSVFDANNFYIIENKDFGEYNILQVFPIEGNEDFIKDIEREINNAFNKRRKKVNINNGRVKYNSRNNSIIKSSFAKEGSWSEYIDRILKEIETTRNK